jgi:hypothetical protein
MERQPRNAVRIASNQQTPTEQEVYATANFWRAKARSDGKVTRELMPGLVTGDPPLDLSGLTQNSILGYRRSV